MLNGLAHPDPGADLKRRFEAERKAAAARRQCDELTEGVKRARIELEDQKLLAQQAANEAKTSAAELAAAKGARDRALSEACGSGAHRVRIGCLWGADRVRIGCGSGARSRCWPSPSPSP